MSNGLFLELAQGVVEWGMAHNVDTATVAIDWRLMVVAMQLRFFVRPLGFPKRVGREEIVALRLSYVFRLITSGWRFSATNGIRLGV